MLRCCVVQLSFITHVYPLREVTVGGCDGILLIYDTALGIRNKQHHAIWIEPTAQAYPFYQLMVAYHTGPEPESTAAVPPLWYTLDRPAADHALCCICSLLPLARVRDSGEMLQEVVPTQTVQKRLKSSQLLPPITVAWAPETHPRPVSPSRDSLPISAEADSEARSVSPAVEATGVEGIVRREHVLRAACWTVSKPPGASTRYCIRARQPSYDVLAIQLSDLASRRQRFTIYTASALSHSGSVRANTPNSPYVLHVHDARAANCL